MNFNGPFNPEDAAETGRAAEPNSANQLIASSSVITPDRPDRIAAFNRMLPVVISG